MDARLFKPLGMTHTTFRPTVAMTFPLSQGHDAVGAAKPTVVRPFVNDVGDWPAGFAYYNAFDLTRFAIAFINGGGLTAGSADDSGRDGEVRRRLRERLAQNRVVRQGLEVFRKDFYPPTAEEGPGRAFEVPVEKGGTSLAFLSIIFDRYDRRGNEERYRLFLKWTTRIGFGVAGCTYALDFLTL